MKKAALFFMALLFVLPAPASGGAFEAEAVYVIDGDTFQFEVGLINVIIRGRCRMLRYNAPELTGPELTEKERRQGMRAKEKLRELIEGKTVRIESGDTDKYGRWLCEVRLPDGTNVNGVMREFLKDYRDRDKYLDKAPGLWASVPKPPEGAMQAAGNCSETTGRWGKHPGKFPLTAPEHLIYT